MSSMATLLDRQPQKGWSPAPCLRSSGPFYLEKDGTRNRVFVPLGPSPPFPTFASPVSARSTELGPKFGRQHCKKGPARCKRAEPCAPGAGPCPLALGGGLGRHTRNRKSAPGQQSVHERASLDTPRHMQARTGKRQNSGIPRGHARISHLLLGDGGSAAWAGTY